MHQEGNVWMFLVCLQMIQWSTRLQSSPNPSFLLFYESKVQTLEWVSFTLCGNWFISEVGLSGFPAVKTYCCLTVAWGGGSTCHIQLQKQSWKRCWNLSNVLGLFLQKVLRAASPMGSDEGLKLSEPPIVWGHLMSFCQKRRAEFPLPELPVSLLASLGLFPRSAGCDW